MCSLGFTEEEINDQLGKNSQAKRPGQESSGQRRGQESRPDRNGEGAPDGRRNSEAGQEAFGLTQQTNDQAAEQFAQQKAAKEKEAADKKAAEDKAKADAEANDFRLAGSDRAADVAVAGGQQDIFAQQKQDKPAAVDAKKEVETNPG